MNSIFNFDIFPSYCTKKQYGVYLSKKRGGRGCKRKVVRK